MSMHQNEHQWLKHTCLSPLILFRHSASNSLDWYPAQTHVDGGVKYLHSWTFYQLEKLTFNSTKAVQQSAQNHMMYAWHSPPNKQLTHSCLSENFDCIKFLQRTFILRQTGSNITTNTSGYLLLTWKWLCFGETLSIAHAKGSAHGCQP